MSGEIFGWATPTLGLATVTPGWATPKLGWATPTITGCVDEPRAPFKSQYPTIWPEIPLSLVLSSENVKN